MTSYRSLIFSLIALAIIGPADAVPADQVRVGASPTSANGFVPVRNVTDPGVVVTRQSITPAGMQSVFDGRVYGVAFGARSDELWVLDAKRAVALNWRENRVTSTIKLVGKPGLQGIAVNADGRAFFSVGSAREVNLMTATNDASSIVTKVAGTNVPGTVAIARGKNAAGQRIALIPIIARNTVAVVDLESGRALGSVPTGVAPVGAAINAAGTVGYVSNWAGRMPEPKDKTAPAGRSDRGREDPVVIDDRGIASTGTVTKIDLTTMRPVAQIAVDLHPMAVLWDEEHHRLYVANGNSDTVSVIDTRTDTVAKTITLRPFGPKVIGVAPTALALTKDGAKLFVACGGINAVAVVRTADGAIEGLIPTAWYPNDLSLSADDQWLAVSTLLGVGSGWREDFWKRFVHAYRGTVHVLPMPDAAQLANCTTAVAENNRQPLTPVPATVAAAAIEAKPIAIPRRAGEPSLIEHVVYIIKENRTYDQVLGDMKKGNGDPSLVMFGEQVTPNQHRLADQFVLLDNFYASGGNSGDGHQWVTQANETDYAMWPGWDGRSYPYDGTDPIAFSSGGFLWDYALRAKKTVQVFGEFAPSENRPTNRIELFQRWRAGDQFENEWNTTSPIPPLDRVLVRNFPGFSVEIPDVIRARIFLNELKKWETAGKMPNLVMMLLPCNHTLGTKPGANTPKAMVADNDLAVGQIVEGLTRSPFWQKMAIFIVEDDAQNGVDHVDGHRTVALAISPYTRRGLVDSTFYAHTSILKTIELILGLPTMSLFDLIANDMRASFRDEADFTPYQSVVPPQSLDELNPSADVLRGEARKSALASAKMRFDVPDAVPSDKLNRILWHDARGWSVPYPNMKTAAFAPLSVDLDDDER